MSELRLGDWSHLLELLEAEVRSRFDPFPDLSSNELWREVRDRVRGIAERILSDLPREDTEDVVQAVLLKLQSPHVLDQVRAARFTMGYVVVMIRNMAHDLARRRTMEREALLRLGKHFIESSIGLELEEEPNREDRLREELLRLSPEERTLLTLRFWEGLRINEIAALRKEAYSAVAVRLFRLLRRLEDRLRDPPTEVCDKR